MLAPHPLAGLCVRRDLVAQVDETLRTCAEVHNLAVHEAKLGKPVVLTGIVTFFEKPANSLLVVQDFSGGVYVEAKDMPFSGKPGDRVEITGVTSPGGFAPVVVPKSYRILGPGTMPEPVPMTLGELQMGHADCLRVSFKSRVRSVSFGSRQVPFNPPRLVLELGDHQAGLIQAHLLDWKGIETASLIDAEVEITGVASGHFNDRRQIVIPRIIVQTGADLQVTKSPRPPERVPFLKIDQIFTYRSATTTESRVRLEGVVVASNAPDWIAIQDDGSGILLQPAPLTPVQIGDTLAVLGYPFVRDMTAFIVGARLEVTGKGELPAPLPLAELSHVSGVHACRVTARGTLLEPPAMIAGLARLRLETPGGVILIEVPECTNAPAAWQTGAQLAATGVCLAEHSPEAIARRFPQPDRITIHVIGPASVKLLSSAPWWTPRRLAHVMAGLLIVLAGTALTVDTNRNISGITFSNTSDFGYTLSGGNILLSTGGVIQTTTTNGTHTDAISSAIEIQGDGGIATFGTNSATATRLLSIEGNVSGIATLGKTTALALKGANTGANTISSEISDGLFGGKLSLTKSEAGKWILSGANTYTGGTSVSGGTLVLSGGNDRLSTIGNISVSTSADGDGIDLGGNIQNTSGNVTVGRGKISNGTINLTGAGTYLLTAKANISANPQGTATTTLTVNNGANTATLSGNNTFGGGVTITGASTSVLSMGSATALGRGTLTFNGGTLGSTGTLGSVTISNAITANGSNNYRFNPLPSHRPGTVPHKP